MHYFELDNRQMIFVFAGFIVVCLFVFAAGVMVGSKMTAEKEVPVKEENKLRAKIKAPSLLEDKKEKAIEKILTKDQKKVYEQLKKEMQDKMEKQRRGRRKTKKEQSFPQF